MKVLLVIGFLCMTVQQSSFAGGPLAPCRSNDEFFQPLDARIDAGLEGRIVGSVTVIPNMQPEFAVRILERDGSYVVHVTDFERSVFYTSPEKRSKIPMKTQEFALTPERAGRIAAILGREISRRSLRKESTSTATSITSHPTARTAAKLRGAASRIPSTWYWSSGIFNASRHCPRPAARRSTKISTGC